MLFVIILFLMVIGGGFRRILFRRRMLRRRMFRSAVLASVFLGPWLARQIDSRPEFRMNGFDFGRSMDGFSSERNGWGGF